MNGNVQKVVNTSVHRKYEQIEALLVALGYKGLDDYETGLRSKDMITCPAVTAALAALGANDEQQETINIVRSLLKEANIPYTMTHRRDGNYLMLEPPKLDLITYLNNKVRLPPAEELFNLPADFCYRDYFGGLSLAHSISPSALKLLAKDEPDRPDAVIQHQFSNILDYYVRPDKDELLVRLVRNHDGFYGATIYICDEEDTILQEVHEPVFMFGDNQKTYKVTAKTYETAIYMLLLQYSVVYAVIPMEANTTWTAARGKPLSITIYYSGIYLDMPHRKYLRRANDIKPMYCREHEMTAGMSSFRSCDKVVLQVHREFIVLPGGGLIYDIHVQGKHSDLQLSIGGDNIPITTCYSNGLTYITDFTESRPIHSRILRYHEVAIRSRSAKELTVTFSVSDKDHTDNIPTISDMIEVDHGTYHLCYYDGLGFLKHIPLS